MAAANVATAIFSVILIIGIIIALVFAIRYHHSLTFCENTESRYCLNFKCPNATAASTPCHGYAQRTGDNGQVQCSVRGLSMLTVEGS